MHEWGLSFHVEYKGRKYLLDTGSSDIFIKNATKLGIDISEVDCAFLSHAHFDHSKGTASFFRHNYKAILHVSTHAAANCYSRKSIFNIYIGIPKNLFKKWPDRIIRHAGVSRVEDGVFMVSHSTSGLEAIGRQNQLMIRKNGFFQPDDFSHEMTLVFRTDKGLVIFNSCSHSGAEVIISEVRRAFPNDVIIAYFGGLHLFRMNEEQVKAVADKIAASDIPHFYTGHCTGTHAFSILKDRMGDRISQFFAGMQIEIQ